MLTFKEFLKLREYDTSGRYIDLSNNDGNLTDLSYGPDTTQHLKNRPIKDDPYGSGRYEIRFTYRGSDDSSVLFSDDVNEVKGKVKLLKSHPEVDKVWVIDKSTGNIIK